MATSIIEPQLAEELSPSQVRTMIDCSAKWMFKYLAGLPDPPSGKMALGVAVHDAVWWVLDEKLGGREIEPAKAQAIGREAFEVNWQDQAERTEFRDDENPKEYAQQGVGLVELFVRDAVPDIHPAEIEKPVSGLVNGVKVRGFIDLLTVEGDVIDLKTRAKKPTSINDDLFQLTTYSGLSPKPSGTVKLFVLTKTKVPALYSFTHRVSPEDALYVRTMYPLAQSIMREGLYVPNRGSNLCSRRNCPFWRECEKEFGGRVEET